MTKHVRDVFRKIGHGRQRMRITRRDFLKTRQLFSMANWLLTKVINDARKIMESYEPTGLDNEIEEKLMEALRMGLEAERLVVWCCNASELEAENTEEPND